MNRSIRHIERLDAQMRRLDRDAAARSRTADADARRWRPCEIRTFAAGSDTAEQLAWTAEVQRRDALPVLVTIHSPRTRRLADERVAC
ncbi:MAG TPA: hypothetical protein VGB53_05740 [Rubricoccaceae bacterium]